MRMCRHRDRGMAIHSSLRNRGLNLGVDFSTQQEHQSSDVEPHEQDDDGAERTVRLRIRVEEMQVDAKPERSQQPACNPNCAAGRKANASASCRPVRARSALATIQFMSPTATIAARENRLQSDV